ncbi:MAG: hypothetical protein ACTHK8_14900 [Ginsengibacter sp.]
MIKRPFLLACLFLITSSVLSQKFNWQEREVKNDTDLLKTTTWITAFSPTSKGMESGTGFFFYSIAENKLFLVTNKHVVLSYSNLVFGFNKSYRNDESFGILLSKENTYSFNGIDLVAIRIDSIPYLNLSEFPYFKVFTEKNIIQEKNYNLINLYDANLISLSFPGLTTIPMPFQPYIIHCHFATPYTFKFQNTNDFCVNGSLTNGCSGSPIILINRTIKTIGKYNLLGIYYFTFSNYQSIDSTSLDTAINDRLKPIYKIPVVKNGNPVSFGNYDVNKDLGIGRAIKAIDLLKIINLK